MVLKLEKKFFGFTNDLYVANVYIVPENSVLACHDIFDILGEGLSRLPPQSDVLVCDDHNARTNLFPDFSDDDLCGKDGDLPTLKSVGNKRSTLIREMAKYNKLTRYSNDKSCINRHGTHLLELCKAAGMLIITGSRLARDQGIGNFTRVYTTGCTTVDYMICNPSLFRCIRDYLKELESIMIDFQSTLFRQNVPNTLVELEDTNRVASAFNEYVTQAVERVCKIPKPTGTVKIKGAPCSTKNADKNRPWPYKLAT